MKIHIWLFLLLICPVVTAIPEVTNVNGDFSTDGSTITISGNNFGVHGHIDEISFLGGKNGWIENAQTDVLMNQPHNNYLPTPNSGTWRFMLQNYGIGSKVVQDNGCWSGSNCIYYPVTETSQSFRLMYIADQPNEEMYVTWNVKEIPGYSSHNNVGSKYYGVGRNGRFFEGNPPNSCVDESLYGGATFVAGDLSVQGGQYVQPNIGGSGPWSIGGKYIENNYVGCMAGCDPCPGGIECYYDSDSCPSNCPPEGCTARCAGLPVEECNSLYDLRRYPMGKTDWNTVKYDNHPHPGEWSRWEFYQKQDPTGGFNGERWFAIDATPERKRSLSSHIINVRTNPGLSDTGCDGAPCNWLQDTFHWYWFHDSRDEEGNFWPYAEMDIYFDDFYVQMGTQARVELCDKPDYTQVTHCEIQLPTSWSNLGDNIQMELNYGAFQSGETAYVIVIDENNVAGDGFPIILGETPDPLLMHSSMSNNEAIWHPEVSQATYANQGDAIRNSDNVNFVSGRTGTASKHGVDVSGYGDFRFRPENFDFYDFNQDGGRLDMIVRFDTEPQTHETNKWFIVDPTGTREINFEITGGGEIKYPMFDIYGTPGSDLAPYGRFRASTHHTVDSYWNTQVNEGEWHTYTLVWRNNGGLHRDDAYIFIDGVRVSKASAGNLPIQGLQYLAVPAAAYGGPVLVTIDEIYSFNSWNVADYPVPALDWPEEIYLQYPIHTAYPQWGRPVSHTNMPEYQFMVQNDLAETSNCEMYVDGSLIQSFPNVPNMKQMRTIPNLPLNNQDHTWRVECDNGRIVSDTFTFAVDYTAGEETCTDGTQNQDETGIDCGGVCPACPTCTDGTQNGDETGIDCGGSCPVCDACANGETRDACTTTAGCDGIEQCTNSIWACIDNNPNDGCPVVGDEVILQNGLNGYNGQTDACIKSGTPGQTYDAGCLFNSDNNRPLFYFDLTGFVEGKTVLAATLELSEDNPSSISDTDVTLYPLTQAWNPNTVTWNSFTPEGGAYDDTKGVLGHLPRQTGTESFDVTTWVQDWSAGTPNNGFILIDEAGGGLVNMVTGNASEIQEQKPKLTLIFSSSSCTSEYDFVGTDCRIDFDDFMQVVAAFRTTDTTYDFNNDNQVNVLDLVLHLLNWS